jgi:hypothetical protein
MNSLGEYVSRGYSKIRDAAHSTIDYAAGKARSIALGTAAAAMIAGGGATIGETITPNTIQYQDPRMPNITVYAPGHPTTLKEFIGASSVVAPVSAPDVSLESTLEQNVNETTSPWMPPELAVILGSGFDLLLGPYAKLGTSLSGVFGLPNAIGSTYVITNFDFWLDKGIAELFEGYINLPGKLTLFPLGQAVGVGATFGGYLLNNPEDGIHGFGGALGVEAFICENKDGAPIVIFVKGEVGYTYRGIQANLFVRAPIEVYGSAKYTRKIVQDAQVGGEFDLRLL